MVDATIGNGYDTLFLCKKATQGMVFGFDIQDDAIVNTSKVLVDYNNFKLYKKSHEYIYDTLSDYEGKISLILFNLGYLPGGNKDITTKFESTIKALEGSIKLLNNKGAVLVVIYPGHDAGKKEEAKILDWLKEKDIKHTFYRNTENVIAPYLLVLYK